MWKYWKRPKSGYNTGMRCSHRNISVTTSYQSRSLWLSHLTDAFSHQQLLLHSVLSLVPWRCIISSSQPQSVAQQLWWSNCKVIQSDSQWRGQAMLAMLSSCLCGGAIYMWRQLTREEAYAAKSALLHSSIKRDSNGGVTVRLHHNHDPKAAFQSKSIIHKCRLCYIWVSWMCDKETAGRVEYSFLFFLDFVCIENWLFLFMVCSQQNRSRVNGLASTWWCNQ